MTGDVLQPLPLSLLACSHELSSSQPPPALATFYLGPSPEQWSQSTMAETMSRVNISSSKTIFLGILFCQQSHENFSVRLDEQDSS